MGLFTSVLAIAATAGSQIYKGMEQKKTANRNAAIADQQAGLIDEQAGLEAYRYDRAKQRYAGAATARTAKSGFAMSGSPMAVMLDSLTQIELDKSIGQFNLDMEKRYARSGADEYRRQGSSAFSQGLVNAFSSTLRGGYDYGMRSGMLLPKPQSTNSIPTF